MTKPLNQEQLAKAKRKAGARTKAANGFGYLASQGFSNELKNISLNSLDIGSACNCVLGQLFAGTPAKSGYVKGMDEFELSDTTSVAYGFSADPNEDSKDVAYYPQLTTAWRHILSAHKTPV